MNTTIRTPVAWRRLLFSNVGELRRSEFMIQITMPYCLKDGDVTFPFDLGAAGCDVIFEGLPEKVEVVYGADTVQALKFALDFDRTLRRLRRKYEFFWPSGEPYFDD